MTSLTVCFPTVVRTTSGFEGWSYAPLSSDTSQRDTGTPSVDFQFKFIVRYFPAVVQSDYASRQNNRLQRNQETQPQKEQKVRNRRVRRGNGEYAESYVKFNENPYSLRVPSVYSVHSAVPYLPHLRLPHSLCILLCFSPAVPVRVQNR